MTFAGLASGERVFLDANTFVYHFTSHAAFGTACRDLIQRIEQDDLFGFTSTPVLSEVSHRIMIIEAANLAGWGASNIKRRLQRQPQVIAHLPGFRNAVQSIIYSRVQLITPVPQLVLDATMLSQQFGLLSNDALIVAAMQQHSMKNIASGDSDFDRVQWITRYGPA